MTIQGSTYDLAGRTRREMRDAGFDPDFTVQEIRQAEEARRIQPPIGADVRDRRDLLWSSIDNRNSRDLDQIEVAETLPNGNFRLSIGIADVDAYLAIGSPIDKHARDSTTSLYTGGAVFPMLPDALSTDATSLIEEDRLAVITELEISPQGVINSHSVYRALVRNRARLDYEHTGAWLDDDAPTPNGILQTPGMETQVKTQFAVAKLLAEQRRLRGSLEFATVEAEPIVENGSIVDITVPRRNGARLLIENLMIAANSAIAEHLEATGLPSIQRVVREPAQWSRIREIAAQHGEHLPELPDALALSQFLCRKQSADPDHFPDLSLVIVKLMGAGEYMVIRKGDAQGHFALAEYRYTHSTAPNRRFADLVTQRLIKCRLGEGCMPYTDDELGDIARHCSEREKAANKLERRMRKIASAILFHDRVGRQFDAFVTGATTRGTFARAVSPPLEGRIVRGEGGLRVGDRVHVRLLSADPETGFIDLERIRLY